MWRSAILAGLALFVLGCAESAEQNTFLVRVSSINDGAPLQADVISIDDSQDPPVAYIPEDVVTAEFTNKVYSSSVVTDPNTFWYDFQLKTYTVTWRRADGGPISGAGWTLSDFDFEAATSAIVPSGGKAQVGILLAPAGMKTVEPFLSARFGDYLQLIADIDFVGSPAISPDEEIHVYASLSVNFADFEDQE
ncbi:MAG: hypothetical protein ACE5G2_08110 [Candidatus Krumholzibacteriia bacterium]